MFRFKLVSEKSHYALENTIIYGLVRIRILREFKWISPMLFRGKLSIKYFCRINYITIYEIICADDLLENVVLPQWYLRTKEGHLVFVKK